MEKDKLKSLKKKMNKLTNELKELILEIQENELQNTQEAINFIDNINELSVAF